MARLLAFAFGLAFAILPVGLTFFLWNFGEPPPTSLFWPRAEMVVVESRVQPFRQGNGTMAARLAVTAIAVGDPTAQPAALRGVTYSSVWISDAEELAAKHYRPGMLVRVMRSKSDELWVVRWRFADFLAYAMALLAVVCLPVGMFAFRIAFDRMPDPTRWR